MKREQAVAILRDIMANRRIRFKLGSLVHGKSGGYELQLESDACAKLDEACLKPIVEKNGLEMKEANGLFVIYKKH